MTAPILPGFIVLFFPPPLNFYQSHLPHLLGQGEGAGFLQIQKGLDVLVGDLPVLPDVFQDFFIWAVRTGALSLRGGSSARAVF